MIMEVTICHFADIVAKPITGKDDQTLLPGSYIGTGCWDPSGYRHCSLKSEVKKLCHPKTAETYTNSSLPVQSCGLFSYNSTSKV